MGYMSGEMPQMVVMVEVNMGSWDLGGGGGVIMVVRGWQLKENRGGGKISSVTDTTTFHT